MRLDAEPAEFLWGRMSSTATPVLSSRLLHGMVCRAVVVVLRKLKDFKEVGSGGDEGMDVEK